MRKLISVGICIIISFFVWGMAIGASGARLLQEAPGADQDVKRAHGMPVIFSKKTYGVAISPETILIEPGKSIQFTIVISNPTEDPLVFMLANVKAYSGEREMNLLKPDKIIEDARKEYSKEALGLSKDQEKILGPFIKDKMQQLRDKLLKDYSIPSKDRLEGIVMIDLPMGAENLTIEVTTQKESHKFLFNVVEF